ncbi:MAG: FliM/FliN family flagellar motor switch protein [Balneolaceae bacterium]
MVHSETSGENTGRPGTKTSKVRDYDFKQPKLVSKEIIRAMRNIHEMFVRHVQRIYSSILNHPVDVTLRNVEQVIFSKYTHEIDPPSSIFMFNVEELGDWAMLQMEPEFCIYCVERQSGGVIEKPSEKRDLTRIEEKIMGRMVDKILQELSHIWSPYISFTIKHYVYESKPENIRTISAHAPGIVLYFDIRFNNYEVPFSICYPYTYLKETLLGDDSVNFDSQLRQEKLSSTEQKQFEDDMKFVDVDLQVQLGSASMPLHKLIQLEAGDQLLLNQHIKEPLKISVNNTLKMNGYPGTKNGKKAVKIYSVLRKMQDLFEY